MSQSEAPEIAKHLPVIKQFLCATASPASVEIRIFSTFEFVHSDIRNRLGIEKGKKLKVIEILFLVI